MKAKMMICLSLILAMAVSAQTPVTTAGVFEVTTVGQSVMVPVTVTGFDGITTVSLTLRYNPAVLTYVNCNTNLPEVMANGVAVPGVIKIGGFNIANAPSEWTLDLFFTYNGGSTELKWDNAGSYCEYARDPRYPLADNPTSTYYKNGYVFPVVQIGTQVWMKENINVGEMINTTVAQSNNAVLEKYCYNNLESNCTLLGGFYRWDEMMQYVATEGTKGICPTGWHVPTKADYIALAEQTKKSPTETSWVGGSEFYNRCAIDLKAVHPGWKMGVTRGGVFYPMMDAKGKPIEATNATGFGAIPAGQVGRDGLSKQGPGYSSYYPYGMVLQLWSSTKVQGKDFPPSKDVFWWPVYFQMQSGNNGLSPSLGLPETGLSVRCLKD